MSKDGLAVAPAGTTPAPTMYEEMEQEQDVARGCIKVIEIIAYDKIGTKTNDVGKVTDIERSRKPCFCQTPEDEVIYKEKYPKARIETFTIQLLKKTAIAKLDDPDNVRQFREVRNG